MIPDKYSVDLITCDIADFSKEKNPFILSHLQALRHRELSKASHWFAEEIGRRQ